MDAWLNGIFALGGVALGTALEPVRSWVQRRERAQQALSERCAELVTVATTLMVGQIKLSSLEKNIHTYHTKEEYEAKHDAFVAEVSPVVHEVFKSYSLLSLLAPPELDQAALLLMAMTLKNAGELSKIDIVASLVEEPSASNLPVDDFASALENFTRIARKYVS